MSETGNRGWEAEAKELAAQCLRDGFALANFKVAYSSAGVRITVTLDKLSDRYGSPTVEECGDFSRRYANALAAQVAAGFPQEYSLEVSSPGAERQLNSVQEYERFRELPMKVQYRDADRKKTTRVFRYLGSTSGITRWQLLPAKFNLRQGVMKSPRHGKGMQQAEELPVAEIAEADILQVNLYVDI